MVKIILIFQETEMKAHIKPAASAPAAIVPWLRYTSTSLPRAGKNAKLPWNIVNN